MEYLYLGLKVDVDTERGTRIGVPQLLKTLHKLNIKGTFFFSLGPDHTGWALKRLFQPGFFRKLSRTSLLQVYGLKTLTNGLLRPGPHIGRLHGNIMKSCQEVGHEVGIHCYDHAKWQNSLARMTEPQIRAEINRAVRQFRQIFGQPAQTMGAAGWQANRLSLSAYDDQNLSYASDTRGETAFFPRVGGRVFQTLQIPTTLPTLDELIGRPEYPDQNIAEFYQNSLRPGQLNVMTIHAELEGMRFQSLFYDLLKNLQNQKVVIGPLRHQAEKLLSNRASIPIFNLIQAEIEGRSGTVSKPENSQKIA
jgi:undecaprenyl phosphate-alpha-L-ara4FN deformylase